jgi:hypothetical protein
VTAGGRLENIEMRYEKNTDFIYRKIADEVVLVPVHHDVADMDCIYSLNSVGAFIWERIDPQVSEADLLAALAGEYEAEVDVLRQDLQAFLAEMLSIGALRKVAA